MRGTARSVIPLYSPLLISLLPPEPIGEAARTTPRSVSVHCHPPPCGISPVPGDASPGALMALSGNFLFAINLLGILLGITTTRKKKGLRLLITPRFCW